MSGQFKSLSDFQKSNLINYGYGVADLKSDKKNIVFSFSPGFKIFGNFNSLDELKIDILG